jgi:hypothetical protein
VKPGLQLDDSPAGIFDSVFCGDAKLAGTGCTKTEQGPGESGAAVLMPPNESDVAAFVGEACANVAV